MRLPLVPLGLVTVIAAATHLSFAQGAPGEASGVTLLTIGEESAPLIRFSGPPIEGEVAAKKMHGAPKIGEATAVFNISQAGELLDWVSTVWNKQCVEKDTVVRLADQDYNIKRGVEMGASVITGIEWPELKASDCKKHFEVTAKWQPQNIRYIGGGGKPQGSIAPGTEQILPSNFTVNTAGLKTEWITSIGLPKITPKIAKEHHGKRTAGPSYEDVEFGTLTIVVSGDGIDAAAAMASRILQDGNCEESEFQDILIDMKDQSLKKTLGTFTLIGCGLKKFEFAPKLEGGKEGLATATLEFLVEDFRFNISHK